MLNRIFWTSLGCAIAMVVGVIAILPTPPNTVLNDNSLVIRHANIFDGKHVLRNTTMLIRNGVIQQIGHDVVNETLPSIDLTSRWIVPGLIDSHTHSFGSALIDSLNFGVTSNIDMFTATGLLASARTERDAITQTDKADLFSAGTLATAPGGHGTQFGLPVDPLTDPDQAIAWVAKRQAEGSDFIKLVYMPNNPMFSSLDLATATAIINAAHAANLLVVAHIDTLDDAQALLRAGIDGLVHVFADQPVSQEFLDLAVQNSLFVVPTLAVIASVDQQQLGTELAKDPAIQPFLSSALRQQLDANFGNSDWPGFEFALALENVQRMHGAGITILAGSDAPNPGTAHGATLHQELSLLVSAGLTPEEALRSATSLPAQTFKLSERGTIAVGQRADFLVLNGDPTMNINATRDIRHIFKNGFEVARTEAKPSVASTKIAKPELSQFHLDLTGPSSMQWTSTDDRMTGGNSNTLLTHSEGRLNVQAVVNSGFMFPWAGAGLFGATTVNISDYQTLSFSVRGTPGVYQAMTFSGAMAGTPPSQSFNVSSDWQTIQLPLDQFRGLEPEQFIGLAIVAGPSLGEFQYSLKNVTLR